jgi:hypothetical protein
VREAVARGIARRCLLAVEQLRDERERAQALGAEAGRAEHLLEVHRAARVRAEQHRGETFRIDVFLHDDRMAAGHGQ